MIVSKNNKISTLNFSFYSVLTTIQLLILSLNIGWGQTVPTAQSIPYSFSFDGQFKSYKAIAVDCENQYDSILSFPNPSLDKVSLVIVSSKSKNIKITISDINGRIILNENKSIEEGTSLFDFGDVLQQSGVYFITVEDEIGKLKTIKHLQN